MAIKGFEHLQSTLNRMKEIRKPALRESAMLVKQIAQIYPPVPSGSTYVRTLLLRKSWRFRTRVSSSIIFNKLDYGPWVQGNRRQILKHRATGWNTVHTIAEKAAPDVLAVFEKHYQKAIKGG